MRAGTVTAVGAAALLGAVGRAARAVRLDAYLVGGAVRDRLLGRPAKDLDVAVEAGPARLSEFLAALESGSGLVARARHDRFGTATLETAEGLRLDVAATRRETYPAPAALPVVTTGVPIFEDLARRDFTIHAMARLLEPDGEAGALLDRHGGAGDLASGTIRLLHDLSLVDDPTRIFRAARYAARLGFAVEPDFAARLEACRSAGALQALSCDRIRRALAEVLEEPAVARGLELLSRWGVLAEMSPGLAALRPDDVARATGPEDRFRALLSPLELPERAALAARLNFSRALRRAVGLGR